jgi:hypothetical protein
MDDIDELLAAIVTKVGESTLSDQQKADVYAQLAVGMKHLVWPILLEHTPESLLKKSVSIERFTVEDYTDFIQTALRGPNVAAALHDELKSALEEVYTIVAKSL